VAMTGEITLRGRVLAIGGLKEKAVAALRVGVRHVVIPWQNSRDLPDLPVEVRDGLTFHPVRTMDEVLTVALAARRLGKRGILVPPANAAEASIVEGVERTVLVSSHYYIKKDGIMYPVWKESDITDILQDKKKEIKQFIKKNKLKFRKDKDNVLVQIAAYYEQITKQI